MATTFAQDECVQVAPHVERLTGEDEERLPFTFPGTALTKES